MRGYPQFSFWISMTLVKIYISCIIINRGKNTFELEGAILKRTRPDDHWALHDHGTETKNNIDGVTHSLK